MGVSLHRNALGNHEGPPMTEAETKAWLLVTTRRNWAYLRARGVWAFSGEGKARGIRVNDFGVVYVVFEGDQPGALTGLFRFAGRPRLVQDDPVLSRTYPIEIPIELVAAPGEVPFKPLVPALAFIKNKRNWGAVLQGAVPKPLEDSDFRLIRRALLQDAE